MRRLAEILKGSQRANGGIEECEQVDNKDIIEKEFLISVSVLVFQGPQLFFEESDIFGSDDLFRPDASSRGRLSLRTRVCARLGDRWSMMGLSAV